MEKTVLVICDKIQEINRLRKYFDSSYTIKATNSAKNAHEILRSSDINLILYDIDVDYSELFRFYKRIRSSEATAALPLIVVAGITVIKTLNNTVKLLNSVIISSTITTDNMQNLIATYFPDENMENEENDEETSD